MGKFLLSRSMNATSLPIVTYPDSRLEQASQTIKVVDENIRHELDQMAKTLKEQDGLGLAGVQVGIMKRLIVIDQDFVMARSRNENYKKTNKLLFMINAEIIEKGKEETILREACLSLPGIDVDVLRPAKIKARYLDYEGKEQIIETDDLILAKCIQHEIDHTNGKLIIHYIKSHLKKQMAIKKLLKYKKFHSDCECH